MSIINRALGVLVVGVGGKHIQIKVKESNTH